MSTVEKNIEIIDNLQTNYERLVTDGYCGRYDSYIDRIGALKSAKTALEKQIPKKADFSELNYSQLPVSKCPSCGSKSITELQLKAYCPDCGQRLDWSENDE